MNTREYELVALEMNVARTNEKLSAERLYRACRRAQKTLNRSRRERITREKGENNA